MILLDCFNPNYVVRRKDDLNPVCYDRDGDLSLGWSAFDGKPVYEFKGSAKRLDPRTMDWKIQMLVPCGKCLACRISKSREWANRMMIELQDTPGQKAMFLTLTYNPASVPTVCEALSSPLTGELIKGDIYYTLNKYDVQCFFKRLRKAFPNNHIRYFLAGEYGPRTQRPHYHAIVYGLSKIDFPDTVYQKHTRAGCDIYTSPKLEKIWSKGFISFNDVNWKTCAYTARYCVKKMSDNKKELKNRVPEFILTSRRPGIGLNNYRSYLENSGEEIIIQDIDKCYRFPVPSGLRKKAMRDSYCIDRLSAESAYSIKNSHERLVSDLNYSKLPFSDYLRAKGTEFRARVKTLTTSRDSF